MTTTETAPLAGPPADGDVPVLEALHVTKHFAARGSLFNV